MLLLNSGFEDQWAGNHRCLIFPADGTPYEDDIGNIFTPEHWLTWFYHDPGTWDQPEVRDAWIHHDPRRVRNGNKAILLFTCDRNHVAGFLQQVSVTPGVRLRLTAYAQAWSNHNDPNVSPHPNDPEWSEGEPLVGYNEIILYDDDIPPVNGDPQNDAIGNFQFSIGIDPTGETNPLTDTVVWGVPGYSYNKHHQLPRVEAVAQTDVVTVFLRSQTLWAFRHNDAYWDDVLLEVVDEPCECRGTPRIQYPRNYVLLPPPVQDKWVAALAYQWHKRRFTIGASADDAAVGDLDVRNVIAVNPGWWDKNLRKFYGEHYPDIAYWPVETTLANLAEDVEKVFQQIEGGAPPDDIALSQCDPRWADERFGAAGCNLTYCAAGCYLTCLAMALRYYQKQADVEATPVTVNAAIGPDGFDECRPLWLAIQSELGLTVSAPPDVDDALASGLCAMAEVQPASLEHFVLVIAKEGMTYLCYDPLDGQKCTLESKYEGVESWRLLVPVEDKPPPPDERVRIGLHLQGGDPGVWPFYAATNSSVLKVLQGYEVGADLNDIMFVIRWWTAHPGQYLWHADGVEVGAREFLANFRGAVKYVAARASIPIYVESLNEEYSHSQEHIEQSIAFDIAFCNVLGEIPNTRPVCFCAPVGNPHESQFISLIPLAQKVRDHDGAIVKEKAMVCRTFQPPL